MRAVIEEMNNRMKTRTLKGEIQTLPNSKCKCGSGRKFKKCCMYKGFKVSNV